MLREMRRILRTDLNYELGFCIALLRAEFRTGYSTGFYTGDLGIIKLGLRRPKKPFNKYFWYPLTVAGRASRLRILSSLINRLQKTK